MRSSDHAGARPSSVLHHVALGARDVARVAAFYRDFFTLPELCRHHEPGGELRSIWLGLDQAILMIERSDEPDRHVVGVGAGLFLLAFRVDPVRRAALEAELAAAGHPIEARTAWSSYARDPEGNRVAISHYAIEVGAQGAMTREQLGRA